jgi:hypothetical protein
VDVDALGATQAVQSIVNQLALSVRNPDGAFGGMPGAVSNRDIQFLMDAVPNLTQTPEGFQLAIGFMRRMAQRQQEMSNLAIQYYDPATATVDPAFLNAANQLQQQPLFDDTAMQQVEALMQGNPGAPGTAANPAPFPGLLSEEPGVAAPAPAQPVTGLLSPDTATEPTQPDTASATPPTPIPDFNAMSAEERNDWSDDNRATLEWIFHNDPDLWAQMRRLAGLEE